MRQETFRTVLTMLKLRRYSSAPPPFFFKLGRLPPCNTITPLPNYNMDYSFRQLILKFLFSILYQTFPTKILYELHEIIIFWVLRLGAIWVLLGCYELHFTQFRKSSNPLNPHSFRLFPPFVMVGAKIAPLPLLPTIFEKNVLILYVKTP